MPTILSQKLPLAQSKQVVVLFDMSGWAVWHARYISYIQELIGIAQSQYPERLGQAVLIHVPTIFKAVWYTISNFIDKRTKDKVHFISDKEIAPTIGAIIPTEMVPVEYGGQRDSDSIPVPNCPGPDD